jgi:hypothetical protein
MVKPYYETCLTYYGSSRHQVFSCTHKGIVFCLQSFFLNKGGELQQELELDGLTLGDKHNPQLSHHYHVLTPQTQTVLCP